MYDIIFTTQNRKIIIIKENTIRLFYKIIFSNYTNVDKTYFFLYNFINYK